MMSIESIRKEVEQKRWEVARKICYRQLPESNDDGKSNPLLFLLHEIHRKQGDLPAARKALDRIKPTNEQEEFEQVIRIAEDWNNFSGHDYFRCSKENDQGFTYEQYKEKLKEYASRDADKAAPLARTPEQRHRLGLLLKKLGRESDAAKFLQPANTDNKTDQIGAKGSVSGTLHFKDGKPAAKVKVTLGLKSEVITLDPAVGLPEDMNWEAKVKPLKSLSTETDANGNFRIADVPAGKHDFIAITLDPMVYEIATRFLVHGVEVANGKDAKFNLTVTEWESAAPRKVVNPHPQKISRKGVDYQLVHVETLKNSFHYHFPRQVVSLALPPGVPSESASLLLVSSEDLAASVPFQLSAGKLLYFIDLAPVSDKVIALYQAVGNPPAPVAAANLLPKVEAGGKTALIETGRAVFRIAYGEGSDVVPPLVAVKGEDGLWRGQGRFLLPAGVEISSRKTTVLESGALVLTVKIDYHLSNGSTYSWILTVHKDEPYLLVREISPEIEGASFDFSLREWSGGRGYLYWKLEYGDTHWSELTAVDRELARLQESVAWWCPPQSFGYSMTPPDQEQHDYIGVFTIRRGDWIDRKFEKICNGPGDDNRELDWPHPEMVGSTISMITANTDATGDAFYRFGFFDGERQWGIIVSTLERNDGWWKEISAAQHKNSSPRLDDFKEWHLDEQDKVARPFVLTKRSKLIELRKKRNSPKFAPYWNRIKSGHSSIEIGVYEEGEDEAPGMIQMFDASGGMYFAVGNEPLMAWQKKLELVHNAQIRAKMILLGRDFGDMYSPVGSRALAPWAEEYDLVVASGVFTQEEERFVRQFLLLMAHMFMNPDLMNWKYNGRNANFEADRVDTVGTIGLCFLGNPDSERFIQHGISLMEKTLNVYCTPGSGRWYENVSCYFLHGAKCRLNFAFHLYEHGIFDVTKIKRFRDFINWGIRVLMPPTPHSYDVMRDGVSEEEYFKQNLVRRIAPIGDHAHIGPWVPDFYAAIAKVYREKDRVFSDYLLAAYNEGGRNGGYYADAPMLFASLDEEDLRDVKLPEIQSRRLEGFGAIFRDHFGTKDEFYLLFKQGPGGYRYHRTEGSLILFAGGRPLLYDGGEAGDTWRHSTLSFYEVGMPLAAGHVERFHSLPGLGFVQGVHPVAIQPGQPIFANDNCHHSLVKVAFERYTEPNPADVRSVFVARDEYVIIHDDLRIDPSILCRAHLQLVSNSHTGNAKDGFLFKGRFGLDAQVLYPDQSFTEEKVEHLAIHDNLVAKHVRLHPKEGFLFPRHPGNVDQPPDKAFGMRHLMVRSDKPNHYLSVLRPLLNGRKPIQAAAIKDGNKTLGVSIKGEGIDDAIFFQRDSFRKEHGDVRFEGRYAAVLRRPASRQYFLLEGASLEADGLSISGSPGLAVRLEVSDKQASLTAEGKGRVDIRGLSSPISIEVSGGTAQFSLQR